MASFTRAFVVLGLGVLVAPVRGQFPPGHLNGLGMGGMQMGPLRTLPLKIAPDTPLKDLLPTPPERTRITPPWLVRDLEHVPEIFFQKPPRATSTAEPKTKEEKAKQAQDNLAARQRAETQIAHTLAKINHVNQKERDHFIKVLLESRDDLAGLPFMMGDTCRMSPGVSRQFRVEVGALRSPSFVGNPMMPGSSFQPLFPLAGSTAIAPHDAQPTEDESRRARLAAWMQMLSHESLATQLELVIKLAKIEHANATQAIAKLAVFSSELRVRKSAIDALKRRKQSDYAPIVLAALRYPWPAVAVNAGDVMAQLKHEAWIDPLLEALDEPDPRAPVIHDVAGTQKITVREVVRLNHHHNCITCHAPATSDPGFAKNGSSSDFLVGPVTIVGHSLTPMSLGYQFSQQSLDSFVRVDVTYLRQDFSRMQPVPNAKPMPDQQRFDFLVRTREVTTKEVDAYREWHRQQGSLYRPPHQRTAHNTLMRLTGRNPAPTAIAWRALLDPCGP